METVVPIKTVLVTKVMSRHLHHHKTPKNLCLYLEIAC